PHRTSKIANGEFATIVSLDDRQARLRLDRRREVIAPLAQLKHVDYGYASTSHAAQGATVDRVIVNIDTNRGVQLVNRRQFYVSISRARYDVRVYTDDATGLGRQVSRDRRKANALESVRNRPTTELKTNQTRPLDRSAPTELIDQQIKQAPPVHRVSFSR
ncbi:MAG TPA: ATP-binding domain-containing protein, partial [Candidatus Binataceae bacterium]|nr:ATP-binding domain-containing protein [Candidatus Binataceae bacterium]